LPAEASGDYRTPRWVIDPRIGEAKPARLPQPSQPLRSAGGTNSMGRAQQPEIEQPIGKPDAGAEPERGHDTGPWAVLTM
jgi:hypothetical protein